LAGSEALRGRMKIKVLGSFGSEGLGQRPSAFLVDDRVLVDAGTVGGALSVAEQIEIQFALISHAHLDHTAGLAFLTDTLAMVAADRRVTACSIATVIEALRTHAINDRPSRCWASGLSQRRRSRGWASCG